MADTTVITGEGGRKHKRLHWRFVLLVVAVIGVAMAAGVGLQWLKEYRDQKRAATPAVVTSTAEHAQDIALSGNYDQAYKEINEALNNPKLSPAEKYMLLFQLGVTYEDQQKYDEAINAYQKADSVKQTQSVAEAIARTAEEKGDKALAITYYKKAISRLDPNKPTAEDLKKFYEQSIIRLGGQL
jgi:tetratricopeptide (TPR) repeat protein